MKLKTELQMCIEGFIEAHHKGLEKDDENWTPLLVYLHVSRLVIGFILGIVLGTCLIAIIDLIVILCFS